MTTRIKFTAYLDYDGETEYEPTSTVEAALLRGDKHAEYSTWLGDVLSVEQVDEE